MQTAEPLVLKPPKPLSEWAQAFKAELDRLDPELGWRVYEARRPFPGAKEVFVWCSFIIPKSGLGLKTYALRGLGSPQVAASHSREEIMRLLGLEDQTLVFGEQAELTDDERQRARAICRRFYEDWKAKQAAA